MSTNQRALQANNHPLQQDDSRATIINTIQTPLGFFTLVVLIVEAVLGITANFTNGTDKTILVVSMCAVIILLILIVAGIAVFSPEALYGTKPISVKVLFPDDIKPTDLSLDDNSCRLVIRDYRGVKRTERSLTLLLGYNVYYFQLRENLKPSDSVRLKIVEMNGREWEVKPFDPYENIVNARLMKN